MKSAEGYLRRQYICLLRRCAWNDAISAFIGFMAAIHGAPAVAQSIVTDGRTLTELSVNGAVTDITTQTIRGSNAFNSFSRFNVDAANTVNLHLPGQTSNLLNLIQGEQSNINGLVNAYKVGQIGGNVFFLNPHGIVVGAGGVLNVGSLTMATPTTQFMDGLMSATGVINDAVVGRALSGDIPLTDSGLIQVKGLINAADAVRLAGGRVDTASGAQVFAGAKASVAFGDLVNVQGVAPAAAVQVHGGVITIVAAQDIEVAGQLSADGLGEHADGGSVLVMAERNATLKTGANVSANAGASGDGGAVEFSAKDTVDLAGGRLSASAAQGKAGTVLIDPANLLLNADLLLSQDELRDASGNVSKAGVTWNAGSLTLQADIQLTVGNGVMISTRDVAGGTRDDHLTGPSQGDSGNLTLQAKHIAIQDDAQLLANASNGRAAGNIRIEAADNQSTPVLGSLDDANASVTIGKAVIKGGNVSITATANDKWVWTGNEYAVKTIEFLDSISVGANVTISRAKATVDVGNGALIDATGSLDIKAHAIADASMKVVSTLAGFGYGETDAVAKVAIGDATLGSDGAMTLSSQADSTLSVEVDTVNTGALNNSASSASKYANVSLAIGVGKQDAVTTVGTDAKITRASALEVSASGEKKHKVSASGGSFKDGTAASGVAVLSSDTTITASLGGNVSAEQVTVKAELAEAESEVKASAGTGGDPDVTDAISSGKTPDEILFEKLSEKVAKAPSTDARSGSSGKLGLSATFVWADNTNDVTAEVADSARITTPGSLNVLAKAEEKVSFESSAEVDQRELDKKAEGDTKTPEEKKKIAISAAVVVADMSHQANALIGNGSIINTGGAVNVNALSAISPFWSDWSSIIDKFKAMDWSSPDAWADLGAAAKEMVANPVGATTWSKTSIESEKLGFAGSVNFFTLNNEATARIGAASINVGVGPAAAGQDVNVIARATQGILNLSGVPEKVIGQPIDGGSAGFGGSYLQFDLSGGTDASIAQGATVRADDVVVQAHTSFDQVDVTETAGKAAKESINGAFSLLNADLHTIAQIGAGGSMSADDVFVQAKDDSLVINVAGGVARSASVGIGFSVAINEIKREVLAIVGNRDGENGVGGTLTATRNVLLDAQASNALGAFTVAGSGPSAKEDDAGKTGGDGTKTNSKDTGGQGKSGVGISGAASVNLVNQTTSAGIADLASVTVNGGTGSSVGVDVDADGTVDETIILAAGLKSAAQDRALAIAGAGSLTVAKDKSAGLAGAFTWNQLGKNTSTYLSDASVDASNGAVQLNSLNTGAMWSISAAGAAGDKQGIAGSVSYSDVNNVSAASTNDASVNAGGTVSLTATDESNIRSVAGAASYGGKGGFGVGVAISSVASDTFAGFNGGMVNGAGGVQATAISNNAIFSVAAALSASKGVGFAGSVSWNDIDNHTEAKSTDAVLTSSGNDVNLDADDISDIKSIAGSVALSGGSATVGIALAKNDISNEALAQVERGSLSGKNVRVEATENATIEAFAVGGSGGKNALAGSVGINTIDNTTTASAKDSVILATNGLVKVHAANASTIDSFTGAAAVGGSNAVGASGSYNHIAGEVKAEISGGSANSANVNVAAERTGTLDVWAISGSAAGTTGLAGSIALNDVGGSTTARIGDAAKVYATGNALVTADADDFIKSRAGAVGIGGSAGGAGGIAFNDMHADTKAEVTGAGTQVTALGQGDAAKVDNGTLSGAGALKGQQKKDDLRGAAVVSSSTSEVENYAVSAAGGGSGAVAGTVSIAILGGSTTAEVTGGAQLNAVFGDAEQEARVAAYHHDTMVSKTGGVAAGGSAGAGGAADTAVVSHTTRAKVSGAQVQAQKAVAIDAASSTNIKQVVMAAAGGGYAGLAGTVGVVLLDGTTEALVNNAKLDSKGSVKVEATSDSDVDLTAGALAGGGGAGVGITAAVTVVEQNTRASVSGTSELNANGETKVNAASTFEQKNDAYTAAAAGGVGVAGTINVVVVKGSTDSEVGSGVSVNNDITYGSATQDVAVTASDLTRVTNRLGSLGVGGSAGIGAVADVTLIHNGASASVASGASVTADRDITVSANTVRDVDSTATALAGGYTAGIAGAVSVISVGARPDGDAKDNSTGSVGKAGELASGSATGDQLGSEWSASASRADAARSSVQLSQDLGAAPVATSAAASVAAGATINAGRDVNVNAHNQTDTDATATGAAASAGFSVGGGIAIATVSDKTVVSLSGTTTAGGSVSVIAIDDQPDESLLRTYAGGGGLAGLAASFAWHDKASKAQAELGGVVIATGGVKVSAKIDHDLEAKGGALAAGAVGIGAAITKVDQNSVASADLLGNVRINSKSLTVGSDAKTKGSADVAAAAGGLFAGAAGALAEANDNTQALASIGNNAFIRTGTGAITLHADVNPNAHAEALGVAVSGGVSIGASVANADVNTVARATTGANADIVSGSMDVRARTLRTGDTAYANAIAGAGGLLLGASATSANASVGATTEALLGDNNEITTGGDLSVQALSSTRAEADVTGINAGLLAAGSNTAKARTNTQTHVKVGDGADLVAGAVRLQADGSDTLRAGTVSGAGGLGVLIASLSETDADADTTVELGTPAGNGGTVVVDTVDIDAVQRVDFDATANSTSAAAVGASGARAVNNVNVDTGAAIGQNMIVSAQDLFSARAGNEIEKSTDNASGYQVDSGSGGLLSGAAARSETQIRNDAQVSVGRDALLSVKNDALLSVLDNNSRIVKVPVNGLLELAAWNEVAAYDRVRLDSGGAIAIARAESVIDNVSTTGVTVRDSAALLSDGNIELSARTAATAKAKAHSKTYGLAGAAEGTSSSTISADQVVSIGTNAFLEAGESVHLMAGTDRTQANDLSADAETRLWNRTAIPIETDPKAYGRLEQHNDITIANAAQVRAVRDVYLTATDGAHKARGFGEGTDLYREALAAIGNFFGADTSSLKITGGSSADNANLAVPVGGASSRVQVEGSVQAGIRSHQWITVDKNGVVTASEGLLDLVTKTDGQNVAKLLELEIDELNELAVLKNKQFEDFKGGGAVAAALGAQADAQAQKTAALQDQTAANLVMTNVQGYVDTAKNAATAAAGAAAAAANAATLAAQGAGLSATDTTAAVKVASAATATATAANAANATAASTAAGQAETVRDDLVAATNATTDTAAKAYLQAMANAASEAATKARAVANAAASQAAVDADTGASAAAKIAAAQATNNARAAANAAAKAAAVVAANDAAASANQGVTSADSAVASANAGLISANGNLAAAQDSGSASDAALGIGADASILSIQLAQLQGATNVDFVDIGVPDDIIAARSGNVRVSGKALTGEGALVAPGDAKIEIKNESSRFMRVNADLFIPDEGGGQVTFNGMRVSNKDDINQRNAIGQSANLGITDAFNTSKPSILVENSNSNDSGNSGGAAQLWIYGNVTNLGGEAKATSHGTLRVAGNIGAETVTLVTGGDFIKTWSPGYTHQGGDPVARLDNLPDDRETDKADYAQSGLPSCASVACGSTIAGNNVYINAEKLNINGLIQAGLPERGISITDSLLDATSVLDPTLSNRVVMQNARSVWTANPSGATRYFDLTNPTADGIADSGEIKLRYDAEFNRLELADVRMAGGHMELHGNIFSTGNGELSVMDGYGRINITNTTGYDLAVGRLDTGPGVEGMIRITDTARDVNGNYRGADLTPLVTEITRVNGVATTSTNTGAGGAMQIVATSNVNDGRNTVFNPMANRRFNWINEQTTNWERVETYLTKTTWGADFLARDPGQQPSSVTPDKPTYTRRIDGDWLSIVSNQGDDYKLDYTNALTPESKTTLPRTSSAVDCLWGVCHSRLYSSKEKYTWTQTESFQHSLNASQGVAVMFTGFDSSEVKIDTNGQLLFSGLVRSVAGDITLDASNGMATLNADARLQGQQIDLNSAAGAIGTVSAPVRVELVNDGTLTASGRDGVAVATSRGDLLINSVSATQGDVNLTADGDIRTSVAGTAVTGQNVSLVSINGGIHGLMDTLALQVETLGTAGSLSASAVGDIRLQEATGDLRVKQVASVTGDVHLAAPGRLLDANTVEQEDIQGRTALLGLWKEMGLTGSESQDALDRSLESQTGQLKQQYESYFRMRRLHLNGDGSYIADAYNANFKFELTPNQATSLKTINGWGDSELVAYSTAQTDAYHAAYTRFGDTGYIADYKPGVSGPGLTATETASLSEGAQWTKAQLVNALAAGLFRETTDTDIRIEEANVVGRNVTLTAQTGIGMQQVASTVITLDAEGLLSDPDKLALLTAERSDITVDVNGQISVKQYEDMDVTVNGTLDASTATGSVLLSSESDVTLGQVSAVDEVRIKTGASLLGKNGQTHVIAKSAVLEAGQGSLGAAGSPILVDLGASGSLTARAGTDLFVREVSGDMVVSSVFARGDVALDAQGRIVEAVEDSLLDVKGTNVTLIAGDTVGKPGGQNALDVQMGKTGLLSASAPNGIYLSTTGLLARLGDITTQNVFQLTAVKGSVTLAGTVQADAGVTLSAADDIHFDGGQVRTSNGDVSLEAGTDGGGSVVAGKAAATGGVDIVALGGLLIKAPDSIGAGGPLVAQVAANATFLASTIIANVATTPLEGPLTLSVANVGGGPGANIVMDGSSDASVTFAVFNAGIAEITAHTPSLQVPTGNITNYAVFNMPAYSTRIDTLSRAANPGYDVNGFTLGGDFSLNALSNSVALDAFILMRNPDLQVAGNPPGNVADAVGFALQTQKSAGNAEGEDREKDILSGFSNGSDGQNSGQTLVRVGANWMGDLSR
ncbi:leukotoxin LktA family filamentous adhesin [Rhodoferax sp. PAMC 29310]|uniref:leukotoxin LktA family filamentous adhesin n=1 Tax=Rhodoferax sp. PAMC 29310 TaxID=2822760 RepID=UPI001B32F234|nr:leukotoxin LktA family filamentous adhesin [Rhodoferax sp. PAMC 29310]